MWRMNWKTALGWAFFLLMIGFFVWVGISTGIDNCNMGAFELECLDLNDPTVLR